MLAKYEDLNGKTAVVTGANGGMGIAIVKALSDSGALVVASDVHDEAHATISKLHGVSYQKADISEASEVKSLVDRALSLHGMLNCAVNTASIEFETERLHNCDVEDFDRIVSVNMRGTFLCMKYQIKAMMQHNGGGAIVNLASTTSTQPGTLQPSYTASKHGVLGLTKQAAIDYAADGVRVNAVAPGNIDTPMLQSALERRGIDDERVKKMMPLKRFGSAQEIAQAVLWLCSDASSFTTGHTVAVEGGMLLG